MKYRHALMVRVRRDYQKISLDRSSCPQPTLTERDSPDFQTDGTSAYELPHPVRMPSAHALMSEGAQKLHCGRHAGKRLVRVVSYCSPAAGPALPSSRLRDRCGISQTREIPRFIITSASPCKDSPQSKYVHRNPNDPKHRWTSELM